MISTQKYKSLNNNIRLLNVTHLTAFSSTNSVGQGGNCGGAWRAVGQEADAYSDESFPRKERYDFLTWDYNEAPKDRLRKYRNISIFQR